MKNQFHLLDWQIWKQLNDDEKKVQMRQILMYFVSPLLPIENIRLKNYSLGGVKCRTFTLSINGESFVFVPGNQEAILGWDEGTKGLASHELLAGEELRWENAENFLSAEFAEEDAPACDFTTIRGVADYINSHTSPLRKTVVPPMLVAKHSSPVGTRFIGTLDVVTGEFSGQVDAYSLIEEKIKKAVMPELPPERALNWNFPRSYLARDEFYLEMDPATNRYQIYTHAPCDYSQLLKQLRKYNFSLPNENEWEYFVGAGTRRLFRWGPDVRGLHRSPLPPEVTGENMFGLVINSERNQFCLLQDSSCLKGGPILGGGGHFIEQILPLSTYYRAPHQVPLEGVLDPYRYLYRKVVRIEP
ncbi:hypothetical protein QUW13_03575 [Enterococcus hirae]|jgi:hypothetical protein|nr:hypothetical protein [Enterococcaceae bacterium]MCI1920066.1 hypothetical protein [Enterococcaceae bacterium]MDM8212958.1 hypothetical protein [Enterococcus hirae]